MGRVAIGPTFTMLPQRWPHASPLPAGESLSVGRVAINPTFTVLAQRWTYASPLPPGERARVRGPSMQQTDLCKARARRMRREMTPAERALWYALRGRRFMGLKVRRQVPIGAFIADFYCADHRLIIEADGAGHGSPRDIERDRWLAAKGFHVLRLPNTDVLTNLPGCLDAIAARTPQH